MWAKIGSVGDIRYQISDVGLLCVLAGDLRLSLMEVDNLKFQIEKTTVCIEL